MPSSPSNPEYEHVYQRLMGLVEMVLFGRRQVRDTAQDLAARDPERRERFLAAVELISRDSIELAYFFCRLAPPALSRLPARDWQGWVLHLMDQYDLGGVRAAIVAMEHLDEYLELLRLTEAGIDFEAVAGRLERFVLGLNGRPLGLVRSARCYTDTRTLHLPEIVARFPDRDTNRLLFKAMAVHQWAQTWFGTWRMSLCAALRHFDDRERALALFHALETRRLDACTARELPGLHRQTAVLRDASPDPARDAPAWRNAARRLADPAATVADSYGLLPELYASALPVPVVCYQGELMPEETEETIAARALGDRRDLHRILRELARVQQADRSDRDPPRTLDAIAQDLGNLPDDDLTAAGPGGYAADDPGPTAPGPDATAGTDDALGYDEWDYVREQYRKHWCLLRERDVTPVRDDFVARTLHERRGMLRQLRRTFEALRGQDKRLGHQPFGDDIDLDALVAGMAEQRAGLEADERVFSLRRRVERDIAVLFMVDMSGSTKGWINDTEREALVLLCQALETLGDRYAIYGFSSYTHKRCESLRIKRFDEPLDATVEARISGIRPREYTRMGVAIRHLSGLLNAVEARTKLLITLSDGRPDDMDSYAGKYGIEDTRQALLETRNLGIHPFCITIDDQAMDYLPHMYGRYGFTLVDRVDKLPYRVSDVYRRLTM